jgi:hypothetical protein
MSELVHMKKDIAEVEKKHSILAAEDMDREVYPYGLKIHLQEDEIQALGFSSLPRIGEKLYLKALVDVCEVSEQDSKTGKNRSIALQITHMLVKLAKEAEDQTGLFYGEPPKPKVI